MMPQASGYEVCQTIRKRAEWRHIKIIMLSAKGRDAEVVKGLAMGADLYVTKPFSTRDLMARIEGLLETGTATTAAASVTAAPWTAARDVALQQSHAASV